MWDQTVCILQKAYGELEDVEKEALRKMGREEMAGLRASCSETPWLAGAMMVMRSDIRPIPQTLFAVRPVAKAGGNAMGEFELMIHPAFFLLAWSANKQLNEALKKIPEKEIEGWNKEFLLEAGTGGFKAEKFYTHGWLAGICHEIGHILHNPWMRARAIQRTAYAVLSQRFPDAHRNVRMEMGKAIRELTNEGMAELRRAELEAWIRNSRDGRKEEVTPRAVLEETPLLFAMRKSEGKEGKRKSEELPTPEELAILGLEQHWSDLRMAEYLAQSITTKMMSNAEKELNSIRMLLKLVGVTGNQEEGNGSRKSESGVSMSSSGPSPQQIQQAIQGLVHIAQNFGPSKLLGNAPGGLSEILQAILEPPPPWHKRLRMRLAALGGQTGTPDLMPEEDYLYLMAGYKVWTPSFQADRLGSLLFLVDTSGSISNAMLQKAINQILASVLNKEVGKVILQCWDTEVYPAFEAEGANAVRQAMLRVKITGRGGTDLCPVFADAGSLIRAKGIDQVVTITDGAANYPDKAPDWLEATPMLFLTSSQEPPWTHPNLTVLVMEELDPDRDN